MNFRIVVPKEFSFSSCFAFLQRSPKEVLHRCGENSVRKLIPIERTPVLFELRASKSTHLEVEVLNTKLSVAQKRALAKYVSEWFDLETDLKPFYKLASKDALLKRLIKEHYGYRIIGQPDLFESMVWAVLGQQINVQFAYTLKQRFVEKFGNQVVFEGVPYFLFPIPEVVSELTDDDLLPLQFSRQKSKYVRLIAEAFASGSLSKEMIVGRPLAAAREELMKIKGVGNWTANYALMKTFRYPDAFPLEDAGVHNALKNLLRLDRKPTLEEVSVIFRKYEGWEAYATLYLWKSL